MSSLGTSKGVLEIAKFGIYVTIPIVLMYTFANNTKNLQKFMGNLISNKEFSILFPVSFGGVAKAQIFVAVEYGVLFNDAAFFAGYFGNWPSVVGGIDDDFLLESKSFLFSFDVKRSYIVYPPEGPRPPSPEELREMARELARKKNNH
ncbi:hypothetical protein CRYUN_Cryun36dG0065300 [Craigia yunnanensis]